MKMQDFKKKWAKAGFSSLVVGLFIAYIIANWSSIGSSLRNVRVEYLWLVLAGQVGIQYSNARLLKTSLASLSRTIDIQESFGLTTVSSLVNFLTPVIGGLSTRAVYLKHEHKLPYSSFLGLAYANYIIIFCLSFLFGLLGLSLTPAAFKSGVGQLLAVIFIAGIAACIVLIAFGHQLTRILLRWRPNQQIWQRLVRIIKLVDESWQAILKNRSIIVAMTFWTAMFLLFSSLIYWAAIHSLSFHTATGAAIIFGSLNSFSLLVNLTPGSIGIREIIYASVFVVTGLSAKQVVAFSLVDRSILIIFLGICWLLFSRSILRPTKE